MELLISIAAFIVSIYTLYDNHAVRRRQKLDALIQLALVVKEYDHFQPHNWQTDPAEYEEMGEHYLDYEDPEIVAQMNNKYMTAKKEYDMYVKTFPAKDWSKYNDYRSISKFIRERDSL